MVKYIKLGRFAAAYDDTRPNPRLNPNNPSSPPISEPSERKLFVLYVAKTIGIGVAVLFGFFALLMIISLANESSDTRADETKVNGAADDSKDNPPRELTPPNVPMGSTVPGLRFVALRSIPLGSSGKLDTFCENYVIAPATTAGKLTQQRGWMVTGEQPLGHFEAVSFVANLEPGTSGACFPIGGNVAVFTGDQLVGIVFAPNEDEQPILTIQPTQDDRRVRIWSGMGMPPAADILAETGRIAVVPLPALEEGCDGAVTVPNIYGQTIDRARRKLQENGWKSLPEDDHCSGTGYGFCGFTYSHSSGPHLSVITAGGEIGEVSSYEVICAPSASDD